LADADELLLEEESGWFILVSGIERFSKEMPWRVYRHRESAASELLEGFSVAVGAVFDAD
jgi:hypothetical protein